MPFKVIKGSFHVANYSPDGDSIRFRPDDSGLVYDLAGSKPRFNARNHVQLRIEGIDSLETHYTPPSGGGSLHQPLDLAYAAADKLMEFVGITDVEWSNSHTTVLSANDGTRGHILARTVEKNGRPVAFVYAGDAPEDDGTDIIMRAPRLRASYNYLSIAQGYAYPTYYSGLFFDLRNELTKAALKAREARLGVYEKDKGNKGFNATSLHSITQQHTMLPKLFRRLSEYIVNYGTAAGFKRKLAQSRERVFDLRNSNFTHFDTYIQQEDDSTRIKLTRQAEEMVFDEMPSRPSAAFSAIMGSETAPPPRFIETLTLPEEAVRDLSL